MLLNNLSFLGIMVTDLSEAD